MSYASTGTSLSDKTRYELFARTVPPDTFQALALVDVARAFNWTYVSIVSSEGQYGDSGMKAFLAEARARNVCIAVNEKVPHAARDQHFDSVLAHLKTKPAAHTVVLFVRMEDARGLLKAAERARHQATWLASDGWGREDKLVEGVESVAEGAITTELQSERIPAFDAYFTALTPHGNRRNPWFNKYWHQVFACEPDGQRDCSSDLRLGPATGYAQEAKVRFVVDAVYAFAHALHAAWLDACPSRSRACGLSWAQMDGAHFYRDYLLRVNFTGECSSCFFACATRSSLMQSL